MEYIVSIDGKRTAIVHNAFSVEVSEGDILFYDVDNDIVGYFKKDEIESFMRMPEIECWSGMFK